MQELFHSIPDTTAHKVRLLDCIRIAKENGLTLTGVFGIYEQQPFVTSTIGITLEQLKKILIRFKCHFRMKF
jgi:hypothetical protein